MAESEQTIVNDMISSFVSLGVEYATGAQMVSGFYIYAASENGESYIEILFEQEGAIDYPGRLKGVVTDLDRVGKLHEFLVEDLFEAEARMSAISIPVPTEYRIFYEIATGNVDVSMSRDLKYAHNPTKIMEHGPRDWLGERVPDVFARRENNR